MNRSQPTVVITGASTGIGEACSLELDRRGFRVFAGVRSEAAGESLRAQGSSRLTPVMIDVTDGASIRAAAQQVTDAVGEAGLSGLVNNAGICVPGPLELIPMDQWRRQFEVNTLGTIAVTQAFLPLLRKAAGRIVNMSSVSGGLSTPYLSAYCASKYAVEAISDALRLELRTWNIQVSAVEPGPIDTPIWDKTSRVAGQMTGEAASEQLSLYATDIDAMYKAVAQAARSALPVEHVVRAVVHALTARRPKTRYFIGRNVRTTFGSMRLLPDRFRDWLVRKAMGLP